MRCLVYYEKWRQTRDDALLRKIRDYNEDDCRSTYLLHDWLLGLKPQETTWADRFTAPGNKSEKIREHEARLATYEERLLLGVSEDPATRDGEQKLPSGAWRSHTSGCWNGTPFRRLGTGQSRRLGYRLLHHGVCPAAGRRHHALPRCDQPRRLDGGQRQSGGPTC